jgi:hypothetical protein
MIHAIEWTTVCFTALRSIARELQLQPLRPNARRQQLPPTAAAPLCTASDAAGTAGLCSSPASRYQARGDQLKSRGECYTPCGRRYLEFTRAMRAAAQPPRPRIFRTSGADRESKAFAAFSPAKRNYQGEQLTQGIEWVTVSTTI